MIHPSVTGEQVWAKFRAIESTLDAKYNLSGSNGWNQNTPLSMSLQILGDAIILKYDLSHHKPITNWQFYLPGDRIQELPLSSVFDMIRARIPIWEDAAKTGRSGFSPQPSLVDQLGEDIFEELLIQDATEETVWLLFKRIQTVVQIEIERLSTTYASAKLDAINKAMSRLEKGVRSQWNSKDLCSINRLLDAKFSQECSLREALNVAQNNPFNYVWNCQGPMWGKTTSLINVEKQLFESL